MVYICPIGSCGGMDNLFFGKSVFVKHPNGRTLPRVRMYWVLNPDSRQYMFTKLSQKVKLLQISYTLDYHCTNRWIGLAETLKIDILPLADLVSNLIKIKIFAKFQNRLCGTLWSKVDILNKSTFIFSESFILNVKP